MGTTPTMKCLIHAKADVNATNSRDERTGKHTALHFIAERGAVEIIELLLKNGANPTLKTIDNKTAAALADKCAKSRMLIIDAMREWEKNRTLKNNGDILPESEDMGMRHI